VKGGMQDYNYWSVGCMEITLELSCCKFPHPSELEELWLDNKKALVDYLKFANTGVKGVVSFEDGQPARFVSVKIDSREPYFKTNEHGEYYRILLPGTYKLSLMLDCDIFFETDIQVPTGALPLVLNLTVPNSIRAEYNNASSSRLNRYASFCDVKKTLLSTADLHNNHKTNVMINDSIKLRSNIFFYFELLLSIFLKFTYF
jgi:hypothetical protein